MKAVLIMAVNSFDPFQPDDILAFEDTPEGNVEAEAKFKEWMLEAQAPDKPGGVLVSDLPEKEQEELVDCCTSDGLFQVGPGGFTLCHTTG